MRWVLMLFVILAAIMGGEARAVVVMGRSVVIEWDGRAETVERESEDALRGASREVVPEVEKATGLVGGGPLVCWFPGGSAWAVPPAATVQHVRGPDLGGGTKGLLYSLRNGLPTFNRYNGRGDVVAQSDIDGTTTWAASYQADGRRTAEAGTNVERHRANCLPKATRDAASGLVFHAAFAAGRSKEEDPTGLLNEGFRYRDMETGTFISRDPLGLVDGPNVYCYVRQNPCTMWDPEGLFVGALVKRFNEHVIRPAAESFVGAHREACRPRQPPAGTDRRRLSFESPPLLLESLVGCQLVAQ
jgi:RHS repeat-associated protein